ncbi:MAG: hypothetical protein WCO69_05985 [Candidatus Omnitrophota bacterium]
MRFWTRTFHRILAGLLAIVLLTVDGKAYAQGVAAVSATPPLLKGINVYRNDPFRFDFILDPGAQAGNIKTPSDSLIRYFLTALTVPEKDLWVNLSPNEKGRIIPETFGSTRMGRELLESDLQLKRQVAGLLHPDHELGKKFWARVYQQASARYGSADIPVDVFSRVWIVPGVAAVREGVSVDGPTAWITAARMKVMTEEEHHGQPGSVDGTSAILRDVVIPALEQEINEGTAFAPLRQVYYSLILAAWYKRQVTHSGLARVFTDRSKVAGLQRTGPGDQTPEKIWEAYVQAFRSGAADLIREETDPSTGELIPRRYFTGGWSGDMSQALEVTSEKGDSGKFSFAGPGFLKLNVLLSPWKSGVDPVVQRFLGREIVDSQGEVYEVQVIPMKNSGKYFGMELIRRRDGTRFNRMVFFRYDQQARRIAGVAIFLPESLRKRHLGKAIYRALYNALDAGGALVEGVSNSETRVLLAERCSLGTQGQLFFRDDQGKDLLIVEQEASGPGTISLSRVLQKTLMGHLLDQAGFEGLAMREGASSSGVEALRRVWQKRAPLAEDPQQIAVAGFTLEARKVDAAQNIGMDEALDTARHFREMGTEAQVRQFVFMGPGNVPMRARYEPADHDFEGQENFPGRKSLAVMVDGWEVLRVFEGDRENSLILSYVNTEMTRIAGQGYFTALFQMIARPYERILVWNVQHQETTKIVQAVTDNGGEVAHSTLRGLSAFGRAAPSGYLAEWVQSERGREIVLYSLAPLGEARSVPLAGLLQRAALIEQAYWPSPQEIRTSPARQRALRRGAGLSECHQVMDGLWGVLKELKGPAFRYARDGISRQLVRLAQLEKIIDHFPVDPAEGAAKVGGVDFSIDRVALDIEGGQEEGSSYSTLELEAYENAPGLSPVITGISPLGGSSAVALFKQL